VSAVVAPDLMMPTYRRRAVEFVRGRGALLYDADGSEYIDLVAGIAVAGVGHCHPRVVDAIERQCRSLIHVSNLYETNPQKRLAARLAELTRGKVSFFANSGAEAVECALKLARKRGRTIDKNKVRIVAACDGFHGRTLGALSATGQPSKQKPFAPMLEGFDNVPFANGAALESAMGDQVAAVLLEPIQGEAGVIEPGSDYLATARDLCDRWDALLILDEVQTGFGRTGRWFAHQHYGVEPDVMCVAKSLAGGLPIGACLASPEIASVFSFGDHGTTFGGGPVPCAAACAVIDIIQAEGLVERAARLGALMSGFLEDIFRGSGVVRGRGLLLAVELDRPVSGNLADRALERGVLVNDPTPTVLRFTPPLVVTEEQISRAAVVLEEVARAS
jgi:acetylornithine/N-succinyldiaminopimelate aminotransferase